MGTYWGGLNYYHPLCNRFQHIKHVPFANSISDNVVSCIVEDNAKNLWIGTNGGGLNFYDSASKTYKYYLQNSDLSKEVSFKDIKAVYVDELHDNIYVGTHAGGMIVLNRRTGNQRFSILKTVICLVIIFILFYRMGMEGFGLHHWVL